jgi:D-glycero-alpha-D-manno-heptose 1-phosphate guanylyltransferase
MEAIVLAGGFGTRLRPIVEGLPKPLAPVAGRPFLAILLEYLSRQGFTSVVLSVGYKHELVQSAFGNAFAGISIRYAVEDEPLGTGGAIRLAARQCSGSEVFVLNGDSYVELEFGAMRAAHRALHSRLSVCTVRVVDVERYGTVLVSGDRIAGFAANGKTGPGQINAGVYLLAGDLLEDMGLPEAFSFERDVLAARLDELRPMAFPTSGMFIDIGVPADYARAQRLFAKQ